MAISSQVRDVQSLVKKWLDDLSIPLLNTAKKGGLAINELLELIAPIVDLCPEYAVGSMLKDLLTCQVS
jgi:hypothetical protein